MTMTVPPIKEWLPAQCSGCGQRSIIRPAGETPFGWRREYNTDGRYYCAPCAAEHAPCVVCGGVTSLRRSQVHGNGFNAAQHERCADY